MSAFGNVTGTVERRHPASLVLFGLPLLGVLLGAVLALAFGKPAAEKPHAAGPGGDPAGPVVSAGDLRFTLPDGWTPPRTGPKIPGFDGAHADVRAQLGTPTSPSRCCRRASPSLLPPRDSTWRPSPRRRGRASSGPGALSAYDYIRPAKDQRVLDIVVVPTTLGVATIACSSAVVAPDECAQALRGLRLARRIVPAA